MERERQLTELEGAILTEIGIRGNDTAYKVRRAFQESPSVQWRGSAGAVSPAIRRLSVAGLIAASPHPSRAGHTLRLTRAGRTALQSWATDVGLAIGVGLDPFRLRSGVWESLPAARRRRLFQKLEAELVAELVALRRWATGDVIDRHQTELAIALMQARLDWLRGLRHERS